MSTLYKGNEQDMINKLSIMRDSIKCPARYRFLEQENNYFRNNVRGSNVLVLGSGLGHDSRELAMYNEQVMGIEIFPALARIARKNKPLNVSYVVGDMFRTPFTNNQFDFAVLNTGTLGNFENSGVLLEEMLRVAKKAVFDLYVSSEERITMYEEEGWQNVRVENGSVVSDDGLDSKAFTVREIEELTGGLGNAITEHINDFTVMVEVS